MCADVYNYKARIMVVGSGSILKTPNNIVVQYFLHCHVTRPNKKDEKRNKMLGQEKKSRSALRS